MASTDTITPIDLTDPAHPKQLSEPWARGIHGCSTSDDGKRGYFGDIGTGRLLIADTSEVQARKQGAQMRDVGELADAGQRGPAVDDPASPTAASRSSSTGRSTSTLGAPVRAGRAGASRTSATRSSSTSPTRRKPKTVSKLQTEVMLPENCAQVVADSAFVTTTGLDGGRRLPAHRLARLPLRLALLLDRPPARPDDRRLRELRVGHPRLRHPRPAQAARDRLLQPRLASRARTARRSWRTRPSRAR